MGLPIEISTHVQTFLRPVEGFKISANQKFKNKDCIIKIYYIRWVESENEYYIKGARVFNGLEDEANTGWF